MIRTLVATVAVIALAACGKDDPKVANNDNNDPTNSAPADAGRDSGTQDDASGNDDGGGEPPRDMSGVPDFGVLPDMGPVGSSVTTTSGPVNGVEENGIVSFKGIPYAAPPVGDLRFRPPRPHAGWTTPLDASDFGAPCPQYDRESNSTFGDEDCLFLNVWTPAGAQGRPVMVFIHGGGFVNGESSLALYDGTNFAERDVVLISINYRLGPLGFLATDELALENADDSAGNYGLRDQVLALQWIQANAAAFGGDPDNVTIFGESAGGVSVCGHLGSPMSEGLFARGIIQSGSGCGNYPYLRMGTLTTDPAVMIGTQYVAQVGCSGAADVTQCLRDLPASQAVEAAWQLTASGLGLPPFGLVIDGTVLPDQPIRRVRNGSAPDVPVMTGSNADEATIFTLTTPVATVAAYETLVRAIFGVTLGNQVLQIYPASDFPRPKAAYNALFTDIAFVCPSLLFAEAAAGGEPSYAYHFTRVLDGAAGALGAFHALELFYVFGNFDAAPNYVPVAADFTLSNEMMGSWVQFATDGTLPWPAYAAANPSIRIFDTTLSTVPEIREGRCAELEAIGLVQ